MAAMLCYAMDGGAQRRIAAIGIAAISKSGILL